MILDAGTPDFARAERIAIAPSCGAGTETKEPLNLKDVQLRCGGLAGRISTLPVGVRAALRM